MYEGVYMLAWVHMHHAYGGRSQKSVLAASFHAYLLKQDLLVRSEHTDIRRDVLLHVSKAGIAGLLPYQLSTHLYNRHLTHCHLPNPGDAMHVCMYTVHSTCSHPYPLLHSSNL